MDGKKGKGPTTRETGGVGAEKKSDQLHQQAANTNHNDSDME
jgi:hypothetical protein